MSNDDDRGRGLTFRSLYGQGALSHPLDDVVITTRHGTSAIPGSDMSTYKEMAAAISALENLAGSMARLHQVDDETRKIIRSARMLAIDLRAEIERRIK